ncbi:MAG: endolytic transglycosylase MltG [Bacteroidales bacterium]|jgi:UPF0755 protein|nr:endolytic transglycosylase MltG [Bacteroidales bacterium]
MKKLLILLLSAFGIIAISFAVAGYVIVLKPNVARNGLLYIPTGSNYKTVCDSLFHNGFLKSQARFEWVAKYKKYPSKVKPGCYRITKNLNNRRLLNMLISGNQCEIKLSINNVRTVYDLAKKIGNDLESDSAQIIDAMLNNDFLIENETDSNNVISVIIPNTYNVYWTTSPEKFLERMLKENKKLWTNERLQKAKKLSLTPAEVVTLASIVNQESNKDDEKATIASVYLNRLKIAMPLQADPTVVFANSDFTIKRVLHKYLTIDSPYNTYKNKGLPPGPIHLPSISSIDAVLNPAETDYLYFCAKDDFSGYHAFASTLEEHNNNAAKYRIALSLR